LLDRRERRAGRRRIALDLQPARAGMHEDDVDRVVFVPLFWLAVIAGFFGLLRQRRVGAPCGPASTRMPVL
jgi:hypothetical protein